MAQTKRKRRTKHRGNAAGTIEVRGRTGRPPSPEERKKQDRAAAREARLNRPPSWRAALNRALLGSGLILVFLLVINKGKVLPAVLLAIIALAIYVPFGYYTDSWQYRRRMRKRQQASPR